MSEFVETLTYQLYALAWFGLLVTSWNDWCFIAWVALTIAPFLIEFE